MDYAGYMPGSGRDRFWLGLGLGLGLGQGGRCRRPGLDSPRSQLTSPPHLNRAPPHYPVTLAVGARGEVWRHRYLPPAGRPA